MGTNTKIGWAKHSFNPWKGCQMKSRGCARCYMFRQADRWGQDPTKVTRSSAAVWRSPYRWNRQLSGSEPVEERIVFMNSMSDFFIPQADEWRPEIYPMLLQTPNLLYLILTKYPDRVMDQVPPDWITDEHPDGYSNVIVGTSVEDQKAADGRIPALAHLRARYKVVSFEPLLGPIDLRSYRIRNESAGTDQLPFDWAILGGESGYKNKKKGKKDFRYRKCQLEWLTSLQAQLEAAGVPVFVKQVGTHLANEFRLSASAGQRADEWNRLPVQFPQQYLTIKQASR